MSELSAKKGGASAAAPSSRWSVLGAEQWRMCRLNEDRALKGDTEALHDLRVALRRLRVWLSATESICSDIRTRTLERRLRRFQKVLGPARDADVALIWLNGRPSKSRAGERTRKKLMMRWARVARAARRKAAMAFRSAAWAAVKQRVEKCLDKAERNDPIPAPLLMHAGRAAIQRAMKRVKRRYRRMNAAHPEELHALRIAVRKLRYLCEFFAPFLGAETAKTARDAKKCQDVLGDVHDCDIVLLSMGEDPDAAALGLGRMLKKQRRRLLGKSERLLDEML
jgi:CHAD domain-containing protein